MLVAMQRGKEEEEGFDMQAHRCRMYQHESQGGQGSAG